MLALGLVLNTVGIGLFCWLIFALAVYALPFFVAVSIGMLAFHSGAGVIGALLVGIVAGGALTLVIGQTAFAMTRSMILRAAIAAAFRRSRPPLPAIMWFSRCRRSECLRLAWREVFACLGAVSVGATAWMRLTVFAEPRPFVPSGAVGEAVLSRFFTAATRERIDLHRLRRRTGSRRSAR